MITEKLRVKKDGGDFLPSDIKVLIEKLAASKEKIIKFESENEQSKIADVFNSYTQ